MSIWCTKLNENGRDQFYWPHPWPKTEYAAFKIRQITKIAQSDTWFFSEFAGFLPILYTGWTIKLHQFLITCIRCVDQVLFQVNNEYQLSVAFVLWVKILALIDFESKEKYILEWTNLKTQKIEIRTSKSKIS